MSVLIVRSVNHISITTSPRHLDTVVSLSLTHTHTQTHTNLGLEFLFWKKLIFRKDTLNWCGRKYILEC